MNQPDEKYVFHGSHERFETVVPKRNIRSQRGGDGKLTVIFDDISFHATPYKWISLAYTYIPKRYPIDGKISSYNMGVSLYGHNETIDIYGFESLEKSLEALYGDGGYLFYFAKKDFHWTDGLGHLEVITKDNLTPVKIEQIDDPVGELKKLGIKFEFTDLGLPENTDHRNYHKA